MQRRHQSSLPGIRLADQRQRDVTTHVTRYYPLHGRRRRSGDNAAAGADWRSQRRRGAGQRLEEDLEVKVRKQLGSTAAHVARPQRQVEEVKAVQTAHERRQLGGDAFESVVCDVECRQLTQVTQRRRQTSHAVAIAAQDAQTRQRGRDPGHVGDPIVTERQYLETR